MALSRTIPDRSIVAEGGMRRWARPDGAFSAGCTKPFLPRFCPAFAFSLDSR
jgi:hypothetical protein